MKGLLCGSKMKQSNRIPKQVKESATKRTFEVSASGKPTSISGRQK